VLVLKLDAQPILHKVATELENPSLYRLIGCGSLSEAALKELEDKNAKHMEELEAKVEDAKENAGDMEVMDARVEIARFAAKSLSKDQALEAYQKLLDLPKVSSGKKIDALMESARVASFYGDQKKSAEFIESVSTRYSHCALSMISTRNIQTKT
jgi:26S proteasome regulatory subunit N7